MYACAIAPLDQSTTSLGWSPGHYTRDACATDCDWDDYSLQFLADPGTPVVAPFPVLVVSTSPFVIRLGIPFPPGAAQQGDIRITGVTPVVPAGASLDKGSLLGRIAAGQRGTKWTLWAPSQVFGGDAVQQPFIEALFGALGLDIVGAADPGQSGFTRTPLFGGHLLARANGPAATGCTTMQGLGRFERYFDSGGLSGVAPAGYVEPSSGAYSRYGASSQTDTTPPNPLHENALVTPMQAAAGGGVALVLVAAALGVWWYSRS